MPASKKQSASEESLLVSDLRQEIDQTRQTVDHLDRQVATLVHDVSMIRHDMKSMIHMLQLVLPCSPTQLQQSECPLGAARDTTTSTTSSPEDLTAQLLDMPPKHRRSGLDGLRALQRQSSPHHGILRAATDTGCIASPSANQKVGFVDDLLRDNNNMLEQPIFGLGRLDGRDDEEEEEKRVEKDEAENDIEEEDDDDDEEEEDENDANSDSKSSSMETLPEQDNSSDPPRVQSPCSPGLNTDSIELVTLTPEPPVEPATSMVSGSGSSILLPSPPTDNDTAADSVNMANGVPTRRHHSDTAVDSQLWDSFARARQQQQEVMGSRSSLTRDTVVDMEEGVNIIESTSL